MGRLIICCWLGVAVANGSQSWSLVESETIRVISDHSPAVAATVFDDLVATQSMLRRIAAVEPRMPLRVFALKDQAALREFAPQRLKRGDIHTFGFSHTGPHEAFIALRIDRPAGLITETLRHEYAHVLTSTLLPDAPAWLDEGLAEFWSSATVEGDRVIIGRPIARHLELLRKAKWLPFNVMVKQPRGSLPTRPDDVVQFYAQAWAMVHYLLLGENPHGPTQFMPSNSPLPREFESTVRQYVETGRFQEHTVAWRPPTSSPDRRSTIGEARALAERANMLVAGEQPRSALPVARQALAINPNEPLALEVIGTSHFLGNEPDQARQWLGRALATGEASYGAAIYMALLATSPVDQERYLIAAIQARPTSEVAWQRLTAIFERDGRLEKARHWCQVWWKLCGA